MKETSTSILAVCFVLFGLVSLCFAQEREPPTKEVEQLKRRLTESEQKIKELQEELSTLKEKIDELSKAKAEPEKKDEVELLRRLAEKEAEAITEEVPHPPQETVFKEGGIGLQALNPEISITGDAIWTYRNQEGVRRRSDFNFRTLGIHFEAYLDPYTRFKAAVPINENGAELGEAYMTRFGIAEGLNLTIGKFRQQFGVVNRWHKHGLDQVDFPLALRQIFGPGGLNQTGISLDWTMPPLGDASQELTFQLTDGQNDRLFGGNTLGNPSFLLHYKNYRDLSKDTYLEFGLTGLFGWDDEWDVMSGGVLQTRHDSLSTRVFGADLTLSWEPTERMRYRNIEWRSELYVLNRDILAPDGSGKDSLTAWGAYSYLQSKITRTVDLGIRVDFYKPDDKAYAATPEASLAPLAFDGGGHRWQFGPYITWHQSPFVKFRAEYNYGDGPRVQEPEHALMLQAIFAAGPHKHERY